MASTPKNIHSMLPEGWLFTGTKTVHNLDGVPLTIYYARDSRWPATVIDCAAMSRESLARYARECNAAKAKGRA